MSDVVGSVVYLGSRDLPRVRISVAELKRFARERGEELDLEGDESHLIIVADPKTGRVSMWDGAAWIPKKGRPREVGSRIGLSLRSIGELERAAERIYADKVERDRYTGAPRLHANPDGASRRKWPVTTRMLDDTAREFVRLLKRDLTPEQWREVQQTNEQHARDGDGACASHDFLDANEVMEEAAINVGWMLPGDSVAKLADAGSPEIADGIASAWNDAWDLAKRKYGLGGTRQNAGGDNCEATSDSGARCGRRATHRAYVPDARKSIAMCGKHAEEARRKIEFAKESPTFQSMISRVRPIHEVGKPRAKCVGCGKSFPADAMSDWSDGKVCEACEDTAVYGKAYKPSRPNPSLILVTGNPGPGAVEKAWCHFHQRDVYDGRTENFGVIRGMPPFVFALGRCVSVEIDGNERKFGSPKPWLVCSPDDESLWIVSKQVMNLGSDAAGRRLTAVTYDPTRESGKEPAFYRHEFSKPNPTMTPIGNAHRCRAVILDGGVYSVKDWIHD